VGHLIDYLFLKEFYCEVAGDVDIANAPVLDMFSRHACPLSYAP
jgi:hypothetical protein